MAQLKHRAGALRIAALYVVVSAAWILLSDRLLGVLAPDPGTRIWLQSLKGTLFVVASGILIYYMVRRALEAVARVEGVHQQREQWFQALIENISDAVTVLDRDGRVVYVSPAFERITGFALDERLGSNAFDRVHPEDRKTTMEKFQRLAEAPGAKVNARPRMRHKDGTWRITRLSSHNLLDDPAVGGIVVTYADVTRRVRIEKQLRKSEKRFRLMVEGSEQVFFYEHDAEGRFRYLSPSIRMVKPSSPPV